MHSRVLVFSSILLFLLIQSNLMMVNAVNVVGKFYDMMLRETGGGNVDYIRIADLQVIKEVARSMSERVRYNPFRPDCIYPSKTPRVAPLLVVI